MAEAIIIPAVAAGAAAVTALVPTGTALRDPPMEENIMKSKDLKEIYTALEKDMRTLIATKDDLHTEFKKDRGTEMPSKLHINWIRNFNELEWEVEGLKKKYETIIKKSKIFYSRSRRRLSEKMKTKYKDAHGLLDRAKRLKVFLVEKEPKSVVKEDAPDIKKFPALKGPLERILNLLTKPDITWIRILGAVGIGKTTVMRNLNNNEQVAEMFDIVIWVKVSKEGSKENLSTEDLQQTIVRRLKLDMGGINRVEDVADRIRVELEGKRYLLLLDDVKRDLDLFGIGIPQNKNGSKIVLTTMLAHICSSMVNHNVKVEKLSPDEAWNMFQNVLNRPNLSDNPNIKGFMDLVVRWCDGLPLMITVTASDFKQRDTEEMWIDGYAGLKKWPRRRDDAMKEIYKSLSFGCEYLDDNQKNCFYYCALYPEDSNIYIDRLLDCWAAENLLGSDDDGEYMRVTGRNVLEHLISVSLVEESKPLEGKPPKYVKLHKVIRQVALDNLLKSTEHEYLVKASEALRKHPDVENWRPKRWISLVDNKLETLPDLPHCSSLSTLFLQKNSTLKIIPPEFFENMEKLLVLDLHCTGITKLPLSLSWPKRLKVLYLNGCIGLVELPPEIGRLQDLEVLDIRRSRVKDLPDQIKGLSRLRRLLLSFTSSEDEEKNQAVEFNRNVISKISDLKELVIDVESLRHLWNGMLNAIIENVHSWTKLATFQLCFLDGVVDIIQVKDDTLKLCIPEEANLGSFVRKLDDFDFFDFDSGNFQVSIGWMSQEFPIPKSWPYESYVKYCSGEGDHLGVSKLLAKAGALILVNHNDLKHLHSSCSPSGLNGIQGCLIESCNKITTIVDGNPTNDSPILPNLGKLYIKNLLELKSLWLGPVQQGSLGKLQTLILSGCRKLTRIFSRAIIEQLTEIQHLEIEKCPEVQEIIIMEYENIGLGPRVLPRLVELILVHMPKLRSICSHDSLEWPSLERLQVRGCPGLNKLPFSQHNAMKLRSIETEENWWQALQWQTQEVKERFQRRQTQEVNERFQLYHTDRWDGYLSDGGITCELSEEEDLLSISNKEALVQYTVRSPQEEALIPQAEEELEEVKQKAQALPSLPLHVKEGGLGSTETPNVDEWDVQGIQYTNSKISLLPENPSCPLLLELFLQGNSNLTVIPVEFFNCMPLLEVLDLSSTSIKALPPSISKLVALQEFYLRDCELLMELPPEVGALKSLEKLDLKGTELICLPQAIGELVKLESLKFSLYRYADQCQERKGIEMIIPRKSLSKLTRLKELSIDVDPDGKWWDSVVEALLDELCSLVNLEILELLLPTVELLGKLLRLQKEGGLPRFLFHFRLVVGRHEQHFLSRLPHDLEQKCKRLQRCLKYVNVDGSIGKINAGGLPQRTRALILDRHWTIKKLSHVITNRQSISELELCLLVECNELETVFDNSDHKRGWYIQLRYLGIYHMKSLKSIWKGEENGFGALKRLALHTCPELTTVFPADVIVNYPYLEELVVEECPKIRSLVSAGTRFSSTLILPSLKKLSLLHLRELSSISSGLPMGEPVEAMVVYNCPKLRDIKEVAEMNTVIEGEREWWDRLQWTDRQPSTSKPIDSVGEFVPLKEDGALMDQLKQVRNSFHNFDEAECRRLLRPVDNSIKS